MDRQTDGKKISFYLIFNFYLIFIFYGHFSLYILLTSLWFILLEGEGVRTLTATCIATCIATCLFSHYIYLCLHILFLLPTTIHMNVPYYLTIEKGLVHFGSEVKKISYRCPAHHIRIQEEEPFGWPFVVPINVPLATNCNCLDCQSCQCLPPSHQRGHFRQKKRPSISIPN